MPLDSTALAEAGLRVLQRHAARGQTLAYKELHRELGEPFKHGEFHTAIGKLCEAVNDLHETATGHSFMMSALVVRTGSDLPGEGFFKLADRLRRLPLNADEEVRRVFVRWQHEAAFEAYRET